MSPLRCALLPLVALAGACSPQVATQSYLAVINISPSHGSTGVAIDTDVVVTFSEPLDEGSVTDGMWIEDAVGDAVDAELSYDAVTWSAVLSPTAGLEADSDYDVVLGTGLRGEESGALLAEVRTSFSTEGGLASTNAMPVADAGGDIEALVGDVLVFDGTGSYDPDGDSLTYSWSLISSPEGSAAELVDADTPTPALELDTAGGYVVGLIVDDGIDLSSEAYAQVTALTETTE